jgi:NAD(P)-dependent dehydrogenase (short-subunit alcohol dehydrogenase family)
MKNLKNKVVAVTGGAAGIGRETVIEFAKEESKVIIVDLDEEKGKKLEEEIKKDGGEALFIMTDVTDPEDVSHLFKKIKELYGQIDVLVNNAGILILGATHEYDYSY